MKYQIKRADLRHTVDIDGKYDFLAEAPVTVDKNTYQVRVLETDVNGALKVVMINRKIYHVSVRHRGDGFPDEVVLKGVPYKVEVERIESTRYRPPPPPKNISGAMAASMQGQVVTLLVKLGDTVREGQPILVLEAMKMENEILSPKAGTLERIAANEGDLVMKGDLLFEVR
jgi:biotin carboxyl carrier protein